MSRLAIFVVAFTYLMLWRAIINTSANDSFNASETTSKLCSAASRYCLYFKAIGDDGNTFYLVTDDIRADSVVWIANRDEPIYDAAAALFLSDHGVLDIIHPDGKLIKRLYSPGTEDDASNTVASLLDTGNFVIELVNKDGSKTLLWQSFDTPTDTVLPGMTLGVHNKTGQKLSIVSYFLDKAPAPGAFALEWDPNGEQLIIRRKDKVYWASGVLRGNKFDNIPEEVQDMFDYEINDGSISFIARNEHYYYAPWKLSSEGVLFDSLGNVIARADKCYGNNYDGGCQAWETPVCRHVDEKFDEISAAVEHADYINGSADQAASSTTSDCKAACWNNCDCVGFTNLYDNGTGCYFVYGTLQNIGNGSDIFHKLVRTATFPPSLYPPNKKDITTASTRKFTEIWIIVVIISALGIICAYLLWLRRKRRKLMLEDRKGTWKKHTILHMENFSGHENSIENQETRLNGHDFRQFSFASIMEATNSFSSTNKLGEGGFGPVYKGILMCKEVAIKRLSRSSRQGVAEFKNELKLVSELQHMNLVQLLGCCIHQDERLLVYEYMPNKSLDFFLFDSTLSKQLDWKKRLHIIEGIAQGLLYLHKYSRLRIVHRDLKASNILLDEHMNPKISDFGMARIFMQESEENTTRIVGTYGYMPPEYAMKGIFSRKSDVYSFGVLMLEIVSGRRNNSFDSTSIPINLVGHAWELWKEGQALELIDPAIHDSVVQHQVLRSIHIGLLCAEECAVDRPTILEILSMLTNSHEILLLPKKPAFYCGERVNAIDRSPKHIKTDSISLMSITDFSAR